MRCGVSYMDRDDGARSSCPLYNINSEDMWAGVGAQAAEMAAAGPSVWMGDFNAWTAGDTDNIILDLALGRIPRCGVQSELQVPVLED